MGRPRKTSEKFTDLKLVESELKVVKAVPYVLAWKLRKMLMNIWTILLLVLPNVCFAENVYMSKGEKNQLKYDYFFELLFINSHRSQLFYLHIQLATINIIWIY